MSEHIRYKPVDTSDTPGNPDIPQAAEHPILRQTDADYAATWFDREVCPCGAMHERYECCGTPVDDCKVATEYGCGCRLKELEGDSDE